MLYYPHQTLCFHQRRIGCQHVSAPRVQVVPAAAHSTTTGLVVAASGPSDCCHILVKKRWVEGKKEEQGEGRGGEGEGASPSSFMFGPNKLSLLLVHLWEHDFTLFSMACFSSLESSTSPGTQLKCGHLCTT